MSSGVGAGVPALARFAAGLSWKSLPPEVCVRARVLLLDTVGVMVWGAQDPFLRKLREGYSSVYAGGRATVVGTAQRFDPGLAATLNAASCTVTQLSEGHRRSRGDPGPHLVPTALAVAEVENAPGEALLTALVAGYEVAVRAGLTFSPVNAEQHVHGHWAALGAAVTASKLLGADAHQMEHVIDGMAALLLYAPISTVVEGSSVHHLYIGTSLHAAISLAHGIRSGMTASLGTLERYVPKRTASFHRENLAADLEGPQPRFELLDNYFKLYPVCAQVITVIEAVDEVRRHVADPAEIRAVKIRATPAAVTLCGARDVRTTLASKFSIPWLAAARLVYPLQTSQALHALDVAAEPLRAMMRKIELVPDATLAPPYPDARPAVVELMLASGQTLTASKQIPIGDYAGNPMPYAEVAKKFRGLIEPILPAKTTEQLCRLFDPRASLPSARQLAALTVLNQR